MIKIGFDAKRAFANNTGLGNYSRFILKALSKNYPHNDYYLYTPVIKENKDLTRILSSNYLTLRTPPDLLNTLGLKSFWRSFGIPAEAVRDELDIYHGLSNELPFGKKDFKTVVTIHDLLFMRYPHLYNPLDVKIYLSKWKYAAQAADKIIAISEQTAQDLISFLEVPAEKVTVIYQGCNDLYKQEPSEESIKKVKKKYKLPDNFILNVGTIEARKNALRIVEALTLLKNRSDIKLVIVGKATSYKKQLEELANRENIAERIIFLHDVPLDDLPQIYKLSQVFVYPSVFEGFGIPIIEALNTGIPVISSTGSCFSEAGGPDSVYVNSEEAEELSEAILSIIDNPDKAANMVAKGKEYVKRFEDPIIADELMKLYTELLDQ